MRTRSQAFGYWIMVLPLVVLVTALYSWPILNILWLSVTQPAPGLGNYGKLISDPGLAKLIWTTIRICTITTVASVLAGYLLAYVMSHSIARKRNWMLMLVMMSFWISVLVRAFAWLMLLGRNGVVNSMLLGTGLVSEPFEFVRNELGVLIGMVHYMIPYAALPLLANMQGIDPRLVQASRSLGASAVYSFFRVYLPLTIPGIVSSSLLVFIVSLGFYVTPAILGGGKVLMVAEYVSVQALITLQWGTASMLATVVLIGVFGLLFILSRFMRVSEAFGARA
ncbi:MAG: putative spermidine/putrescine transport system permease protein [Rhodospirillaceae bacterium]|jgi:putative spermidine/putrescine transport system permease protein|nr:putative spermidine/putrescine transport system permease protein [Rhodospirillaceae bacterium]